MKKLLLLTIAGLSSFSTIFAQDSLADSTVSVIGPVLSGAEALQLRYTRPAERWTEALPVGNPAIAALRSVCVSYILPEENGAAGKIGQ